MSIALLRIASMDNIPVVLEYWGIIFSVIAIYVCVEFGYYELKGCYQHWVDARWRGTCHKLRSMPKGVIMGAVPYTNMLITYCAHNNIASFRRGEGDEILLKDAATGEERVYTENGEMPWVYVARRLNAMGAKITDKRPYSEFDRAIEFEVYCGDKIVNATKAADDEVVQITVTDNSEQHNNRINRDLFIKWCELVSVKKLYSGPDGKILYANYMSEEKKSFEEGFINWDEMVSVFKTLTGYQHTKIELSDEYEIDCSWGGEDPNGVWRFTKKADEDIITREFVSGEKPKQHAWFSYFAFLVFPTTLLAAIFSQFSIYSAIYAIPGIFYSWAMIYYTDHPKSRYKGASIIKWGLRLTVVVLITVAVINAIGYMDWSVGR